MTWVTIDKRTWNAQQENIACTMVYINAAGCYMGTNNALDLLRTV